MSAVTPERRFKREQALRELLLLFHDDELTRAAILSALDKLKTAPPSNHAASDEQCGQANISDSR